MKPGAPFPHAALTPTLLLAVMSRFPQAGRTKTRLIPHLGAAGALEVHLACLNGLLGEAQRWCAAARKDKREFTLFVTPPADHTALRTAGVRLPTGCSLRAQRGAELGTRMHEAMCSLVRPEAIVVLVGCDLPLLRARHWMHAARALERAELVCGPTPDGGYYLIGMHARDLHRIPPAVFSPAAQAGPSRTAQTRYRRTAQDQDRVSQPEPSVLECTEAAARKAGLRTTRIGTLPDVDTLEDLTTVLRWAHRQGFREREALACLRKWTHKLALSQ